MYCYVDVVVVFTILSGGTETVLTERLYKTTLNTLQRTNYSIFTKMIHRSFTDCMIYRNMDTFIPSARQEL